MEDSWRLWSKSAWRLEWRTEGDQVRDHKAFQEGNQVKEVGERMGKMVRWMET